MTEFLLSGCGTQSIMHYLKTLGIFRVIAMQCAPDITCRWKLEGPYIGGIEQEKAVQFLAKEYQPTPYITPWNKMGGFFQTNNDHILVVEGSSNPRLKNYKDAIKATRDALISITHEGKPIADGYGITVDKKLIQNDLRIRIFDECRNVLPDTAVTALDAMYQHIDDNNHFNNLFGSTGQASRTEFVVTFIKLVTKAMQSDDTKGVEASLFGDPIKLEHITMGHFMPGALRGGNLGSTLEEQNKTGSLANSWDYILMMEGLAMFAGSVGRRLALQSAKHTSYPFMVSGTDIGASGCAVREEVNKEGGSIGEVWAPIWVNSTTIHELTHVFAEGRADFGGRQATNGAEFARAVLDLGTSRGLTRFYRFGIYNRNGQANLIIPMGYVTTTGKQDQAAHAMGDLDSWLKRLRYMRNKPHTLESLLRILDGDILNYVTRPSPDQMLSVLVAVGRIESRLALMSREDRPNPITLSREWFWLCGGNNWRYARPEFRLAASLASIGQGRDHIRKNIEPVDLGRPISWIKSKSIVGGGSLQRLADILEQRFVDRGRVFNQPLRTVSQPSTDDESHMGQQSDTSIHRQDIVGDVLKGAVMAPLSDVACFLNGMVDEKLLYDMFVALALVNMSNIRMYEQQAGRYRIPYVYGLLKMALTPKIGGTCIKIEPGIPRLLNSGQVRNAVQLASTRLQHSGLYPRLNGTVYFPEHVVQYVGPALLFPVDVDQLCRMMLMPKNTQVEQAASR